MVRDKGILIRNAKDMHGSKAKRGIYSVFLISRKKSSHFLGSKALTCVGIPLEDKCHSHEFLLCHLSLSFYCRAWHYVVCNTLFNSLDPYPLPTSFHPQLTSLWGLRGQVERQPWCCASTKTLVSYRHCSSHKCKTQHRMGYYEES